MRAAPSPKARDRRGMSLVEVTLASSMFLGIGYVLNLCLRSNDQSLGTIVETSAANDSMRETTTMLRDELKAAQRASIQVQDVAGFSSLEFSYAIEGAGAGPAWGVFERGLSVDETQCSQPGWTVRYVADPTMGNAPPLQRLIVDDSGAIQHTKTLASSVSRFRVTEAGDIWVVEITAQGETGRHEEEFDVRTRDR